MFETTTVSEKENRIHVLHVSKSTFLLQGHTTTGASKQ